MAEIKPKSEQEKYDLTKYFEYLLKERRKEFDAFDDPEEKTAFDDIADKFLGDNPVNTTTDRNNYLLTAAQFLINKGVDQKYIPYFLSIIDEGFKRAQKILQLREKLNQKLTDIIQEAKGDEELEGLMSDEIDQVNNATFDELSNLLKENSLFPDEEWFDEIIFTDPEELTRQNNLRIKEAIGDEKLKLYSLWPEGSEEQKFVLEKEPNKLKRLKNKEGKINDKLKPWILAAVALAPEEKKTEARKLLGLILGCSNSKIGAITAYLTGACRKRAKGEVATRIGEIEDFVKKLNTPEEEENSKPEVNGATFEYDNEIKNEWRRKLFEFIDENTDPEKRKNMKVLCLPGVKCLEIQGYIDLGFKPENIVGVEKEFSEEFEENAKKYGIETYCGDIKDFLQQQEEIFDVVSLDFHSQITDSIYHDIIERLPIAKKALLLTNFMGKREQPGMGNTIRRHAGRAGVHVCGANTPLCQALGVREKSGQESVDQKEQLKEIRDKYLIEILLQKIADAKINESSYYKKIEELVAKFPTLEKAEAAYIKYAFIPVIVDIFMTFIESLSGEGYDSKNVRKLRYFLLNLLESGLGNQLKCIKAKSYKYYSKPNKIGAKSPFVSQFTVIERPEKTYSQCRQSLRFFFEILKYFIEKFSDIEDLKNKEKYIKQIDKLLSSFYLRDKKGVDIKNLGRTVIHTDTICFSADGIYKELKWKQLDRDLETFRNFVKKTLTKLPETELIELPEESDDDNDNSDDDPEGNGGNESKDGSTFEYDNEIKNEWRKKLFEFLADHTSPEERAKMRVLCLPGRKCLEIQGYLDLGFKPENITGVEGSKKVQEEFLANAKHLGINPYCGTLEELIAEGQDPPFNVISLDFHGQPSKKTIEEIIAKLRIHRHAILMVNHMAKREHSYIGDGMRYLHHMNQEPSLVKSAGESLLVENSISSQNKAHEAVANEKTPLGEIRNETLAQMIIAKLGCKTQFNLLFPELASEIKLLPWSKDDNENIHYMVSQFTGAILDTLGLKIGFYKGSMAMKKFKESLNEFICVGLLGRPVVRDTKSYRYLSSKQGGSRSPFLSQFFDLEVPEDIYYKARYGLEFFMKIIVYFSSISDHPDNMNDKNFGEFSMRDKNGNYKRNGKTRSSDVLSFSGDNFYTETQWKNIINIGKIFREELRGKVQLVEDYEPELIELPEESDDDQKEDKISK